MFLCVFLIHNIPPAPVSRRMFVSMILFPFSVLFLIGKLTVNDVFPIFATSTEERMVERVSKPNIEVGCFSKNPGLQEYSRIVYPFLLFPCPRRDFELKLMLY